MNEFPCVLGLSLTTLLVCLFLFLQYKYRIFGPTLLERAEQFKTFLQPMLGGAALAVAVLVITVFGGGTAGLAYGVAATVSISACGGPEWAMTIGRVADCIEFERDRSYCQSVVGAQYARAELVDACVARQWTLRQSRRAPAPLNRSK